jgi:hypothetical protein
VRHRHKAFVGPPRLPLLIVKLRSERSPSRSRLVVLVFQELFALAFVFAVSLVLLGVQDRGFVLVLLISRFVFAHRRSLGLGI